MTSKDNIVAFNPRQIPMGLDDKYANVVAECRAALVRSLPSLMRGFFDRLDDDLYELADKSDTNQLHTTYFDAMRLIRKRREDVITDFSSGLLADFDDFWRTGPRPPKRPEEAVSAGSEKVFPDGDGLALVDEEDLERGLAVDNMVSKGENRYQRPLFALNLRFARLLGLERLDSAHNPVGPRAVCERFHASMGELRLGMTVLLVVYKLFDKQVMSHIGGLYEEFNALFGNAGVHPPRPHVRIPSHPQPAHPQESVPPATREEVSRHDYAQEGYDEDPRALFEAMRGVLADYRRRLGRPVPSGNLPQVEMEELIASLTQLQTRWAQGVGQTGQALSPALDLRDYLKDSLKLERNGELSRELGRHENDVLDIVGMLFDFFLEDPNLPDAMKALIARLQIPMLKVAIMDKDFFAQKHHPARRLLNDIGRAAMAWSDDGDRSEGSLYGRIESIVETVVRRFEDDAGVFAQLQREFSGYLDRERRGAQVVEERTHQVSQGKEQLTLAKQCVGEEVSRRIHAYQRLPAVAINLLRDGWQDVLLLTFLREGSESMVWKSQLETADKLLWSVQPKPQDHEQKRLLRAIPDLLRSLREALNGISYDQHKMARSFKELQACHIACLRGAEGPQFGYVDEIEASLDTDSAFSASSDASPEAPSNATDGLGDDEFSHMSAQLKIGDWLQLDQVGGQSQRRVKLSWKSGVNDSYVFVDRRGIKVLELTKAGVAKLFREQRAELLEQVEAPIVDRAMNAVIETLKTA